ncbi:Glycosyltransferase AglD [ANME-1 cluster archaeon GoMg2]|nr:Glycosyltransferase AglD [ANME-1 cluster archaeon GoMg2]
MTLKMQNRTKTWTYRIIASLVGIAILLSLVYYAGYEKFFTIIIQTSPYWIITSVIVYAMSWIFRVHRLERFTRDAGEKIGFFELFKLLISGYTLNILLPARLGDVATIFYLKMKKIAIGKSTAIIFQLRILDVMALLILSLPVFAFFFSDAPTWIRTTLLICIFIIAIPICIVLFDKAKHFSDLLNRLGNKFNNKIFKIVSDKANDAYIHYHEIVLNKRLLFVSIFISITIWVFDILTCYTVSIAVASPVLITVALFGVCIANVAKSVPSIPGGIGIYEGALAGIFVLFGTPFDIAITIAILDHAIKNIFTLVFGIPATTSIGLNFSDIKKFKKELD